MDLELVARARSVLINGTHLSQPGVRAAGGRVVFDIDYRPVLWGLTGRDAGDNRFVADQSVTDSLQEVLPLCDLIIGTEEEVHILGGSTDTIACLRAIREQTSALLVTKRGPMGCVAFPGVIPDSLPDSLDDGGGDNRYLGSFKLTANGAVDMGQKCDGAERVSVPLPGYPQGLLSIGGETFIGENSSMPVTPPRRGPCPGSGDPAGRGPP
ncbi:hypothetical protein [Niveispirillum fermenti]|uniref:hypothetical protein n=1 Tax=Niveispirillum fermenti TaxID=1233113 RepID=UPI003A86C128